MPKIDRRAIYERDFEQEHEVLKHILETLQPFDDDTRSRIMESVTVFFGIRDAPHR